MTNPKKIIFDCDNTMGIKGCDVDDGLALLYLLGEGSTEICGITTTYGNSNLETVYANTKAMVEELGLTHIPVLKGCPESTGARDRSDRTALESEAVDFLVETIKANPHEISLLATGSLTNLYGAYAKDPGIFNKVSEVVLMGGITEKLIINGKVMKELNFSCDPLATERVLLETKKLTIITGNNCLDAFFSGEEFAQKLQISPHSRASYILKRCLYWFADMKDTYELPGFYNWDVVAATYLVKPELFQNSYQFITPCCQDLEKGELNYRPSEVEAALINLPKIANVEKFKNEIYSSWLKGDNSKHLLF